MALGEEHGAPIWSQFNDGEVRAICRAMVELGAVPGATIEKIAEDFASDLGAGSLSGSVDRAEELLSKVFPADRVAALMTDMRGNAGPGVWRRIAFLPAETLARFLAGEYPQTVAVVISRLGSDHGGRVLALLPDRLASDVVQRMLSLGDTRPEALQDIEAMLWRQFFASGNRKPERDRFEAMADRFNAFDRPTEARFLAALAERDGAAAQRIREKMFTFEDLLKLDAAGCQTLLRGVDKDTLGRALKGATEAARSFFLSNMSSRAAKNLQDDMDAMGPVRMKEVDEAQSQLVQTAKALAEAGEIRIQKGRSDEEVVV